MISVLIAYFTCAWLNGVTSFEEIKTLYATDSAMLHQAQTMAFTTLAFSELFHMIGMSNVNKSFIHVFKDKNYMLFIAFIVAVLLQLFVIETPGVSAVFSTCNLSGTEWLVTVCLSVLPLVIHELVVFVKWIKKH